MTTATRLHDAIAELAGFTDDPDAGGISHRPDEFTAPDDLEDGVRVLAGTLARLAA